MTAALPQPVCVTGASGFIAAHIVRLLLERGCRVRGTVRSVGGAKKTAHLTTLPGAAERLELFQADLLREGSFDRAIGGCGAVVHAASPYAIQVDDPQRDLVDPAVSGTVNVLRSAAGAGVRRVVLTSSMAAITDQPVAGKVFTEQDWNETSSLTRNPYYYSKTLAERAAWRFMDEQKPGFDLVVINPFMVIGPSLGPELNTTNEVFRDLLTGAYPGVLAIGWGVVDVRDVAEAHVRALENERANGRYLCAGEPMTLMEVVGLLRAAGYGERYTLPRLDLTSPLGTRLVKLLSYTRPAGVGSYVRSHVGGVIEYDNRRIREELGMVFRPARESVLETVRDLERWGHLQGGRRQEAGGRR